MLQQTRVDRVLTKFTPFIEQFPDFTALARAPLTTILNSWQGLGYNRRALALSRIARIVCSKYGGCLPATEEQLAALPGIGHATACAILAFAWNKPVVFIETNIRRVYLHHFLRGRQRVRDAELLPLVSATTNGKHPREWFYALMDYGSMLGRTLPNPNRRSIRHRRQAPFAGSDRAIRGGILKLLLEHRRLSGIDFVRLLGQEKTRIERILADLLREGLLKKQDRLYSIG